MDEPLSVKHWVVFEWDDEADKRGNVQHLRDHGIEPEEAMECFRRPYAIAPDARYQRTYILDGETSRGRRLRLVFEDLGNGIARVFTGWERERRRRR